MHYNILLLTIVLLSILLACMQCIVKQFELFSIQPRILNLVLCSNIGAYESMYYITRSLYAKYKNVVTLYYMHKSNIINEYELIGDILYIKGDETFIPGILIKTVKAFIYGHNNYNYDYIVRSNISTIVDFNLLSTYLINNIIKYGGSYRHDGILTNDRFISGTGIIISRDTMKRFIENKNALHYDIIDDVAIGMLFNEKMNDIKMIGMNQYYRVVPRFNGDYNKVKNFVNNNKYIFYRNKHSDREIDVVQMKHIANILSENMNYNNI